MLIPSRSVYVVPVGTNNPRGRLQGVPSDLRRALQHLDQIPRRVLPHSNDDTNDTIVIGMPGQATESDAGPVWDPIMHNMLRNKDAGHIVSVYSQTAIGVDIVRYHVVTRKFQRHVTVVVSPLLLVDIGRLSDLIGD